MSIYATLVSIDDERQTAARLKAEGIGHGVVMDDGEVEDLDTLPFDMLDAPIIYQGSNVLPSDDDPRGGSIDVAVIPGHIERDGRPDTPLDDEDDWYPWLRLSMFTYNENDDNATMVLTEGQVERLRDALTTWLERGDE